MSQQKNVCKSWHTDKSWKKQQHEYIECDGRFWDNLGFEYIDMASIYDTV